MKIGIDARPLSYPLTGIGFYLRSLLDALQVVDQDNKYVLVSNMGINYEITNPNWSRSEGRRSEKLISTVWIQTIAPFLAKRLGLDLFWSPRHHLPLFLPRSVKTVVTIHDLVHIFFPETMLRQNLIIERMLMRSSIILADVVVAVSCSTRNEILGTYSIDPEKVRTVYSGIPAFPESRSVDLLAWLPKNPYFLFVGTLEPRKNLERILGAFELVHSAGYDPDLVITGSSGWKNEKLLKIARISPLGNRIHFTGYVTRQRLAQLYRNALGLLFPSLYEGFGFPILEAMHFGTPVITSNCSSMPEIAGDAAILVNPRNTSEIAQAMESLISDKALAEKLSHSGRTRVDQFSWSKAAKEMCGIFQEAMDG